METLNCSLSTPQIEKFDTPAKSLNPNLISKVRVIVRVRPFLSHEVAGGSGKPRSCVSVLEKDCEPFHEVSVHLKDFDTSRNESYRLDSFFGQDDNNVSQIFNREVSPLIPGIFHGINATVFAYGATGSGKTYTMQGSDEQPGLMLLAMSTILAMCQGTESKAEISYYEVYLDRCYDLLEMKAKEIAILDDQDGQIHLRGLSRVPINSMSEFHEVFSCGIQRRKVAHTGLNDVSSRSHGVLVIAVSTPCGDGAGAVVTGKLNLIDLAGNEDNRRTCNEGMRLIESSKINQSLFALSNVIYALNNNNTRVPYRDSKLTRILQDSLGGTSRSLMVACLNPGEYQESVHTVSLAARSRHISNSVSSAQKLEPSKVKIDMEAKLQAWLESKGKTKTAQRMGAFGSPFLGKAPSSVSSVKKPLHYSSAKTKGINGRGASNAKERVLPVPFVNLFGNEAPADSFFKGSQFAADDNKDETSAASARIMLEPTEDLHDEPSDRDLCTIINSVRQFPASESKSTPRNAFRKILSPVDCNINPVSIKELSCADQSHVILFEPETPGDTICTSNKFHSADTLLSTPLDKFNMRSSCLKDSLIQGYIDFLNSASREELLELKGIGQKMAEYIVELRETSPLKSLSDLQKIGLSSKQVYNMFSRAARGFFDRPEDATPSCS